MHNNQQSYTYQGNSTSQHANNQTVPNGQQQPPNQLTNTEITDPQGQASQQMNLQNILFDLLQKNIKPANAVQDGQFQSTNIITDPTSHQYHSEAIQKVTGNNPAPANAYTLMEKSEGNPQMQNDQQVAQTTNQTMVQLLRDNYGFIGQSEDQAMQWIGVAQNGTQMALQNPMIGRMHSGAFMASQNPAQGAAAIPAMPNQLTQMLSLDGAKDTSRLLDIDLKHEQQNIDNDRTSGIQNQVNKTQFIQSAQNLPLAASQSRNMAGSGLRSNNESNAFAGMADCQGKDLLMNQLQTLQSLISQINNKSGTESMFYQPNEGIQAFQPPQNQANSVEQHRTQPQHAYFHLQAAAANTKSSHLEQNWPLPNYQNQITYENQLIIDKIEKCGHFPTRSEIESNLVDTGIQIENNANHASNALMQISGEQSDSLNKENEASGCNGGVKNSCTNGSGQVGSSGFRADQQYSIEGDLRQPWIQGADLLPAVEGTVQDASGQSQVDDGVKNCQTEPLDRVDASEDENKDSICNYKDKSVKQCGEETEKKENGALAQNDLRDLAKKLATGEINETQFWQQLNQQKQTVQNADDSKDTKQQAQIANCQNHKQIDAQNTCHNVTQNQWVVNKNQIDQNTSNYTQKLHHQQHNQKSQNENNMRFNQAPNKIANPNAHQRAQGKPISISVDACGQNMQNADRLEKQTREKHHSHHHTNRHHNPDRSLDHAYLEDKVSNSQLVLGQQPVTQNMKALRGSSADNQQRKEEPSLPVIQIQNQNDNFKRLPPRFVGQNGVQSMGVESKDTRQSQKSKQSISSSLQRFQQQNQNKVNFVEKSYHSSEEDQVNQMNQSRKRQANMSLNAQHAQVGQNPNAFPFGNDQQALLNLLASKLSIPTNQDLEQNSHQAIQDSSKQVQIQKVSNHQNTDNNEAPAPMPSNLLQSDVQSMSNLVLQLQNQGSLQDLNVNEMLGDPLKAQLSQLLLQQLANKTEKTVQQDATTNVNDMRDAYAKPVAFQNPSSGLQIESQAANGQMASNNQQQNNFKVAQQVVPERPEVGANQNLSQPTQQIADRLAGGTGEVQYIQNLLAQLQSQQAMANQQQINEKSQSSQNGNGSGNNSNGHQNGNGSGSGGNATSNGNPRSSEYEDLDLKKLHAFIVNYIPRENIQKIDGSELGQINTVDMNKKLGQLNNGNLDASSNLFQILSNNKGMINNQVQARYNGPTSSSANSANNNVTRNHGNPCGASNGSDDQNKHIEQETLQYPYENVVIDMQQPQNQSSISQAQTKLRLLQNLLNQQQEQQKQFKQIGESNGTNDSQIVAPNQSKMLGKRMNADRQLPAGAGGAFNEQNMLNEQALDVNNNNKQANETDAQVQQRVITFQSGSNFETQPQHGDNRDVEDLDPFNLYDINDDTPAYIRLRNQIKQNQSVETFREVKLELCKAIKSEKDQKKMLIEEKPKRAHQNINGEKFRGSKYRGVSKNKNKWQMMIMINQKKVYIGAIQDEIDAAKYYDHIAIISQGLSAKTNFRYSVGQIAQIMKDYDIDSMGSGGEMDSGYNSIGNSDQLRQRIRNDHYLQATTSALQRPVNGNYLDQLQSQSFQRNETEQYGSTDENQMIFKINNLNQQINNDNTELNNQAAAQQVDSQQKQQLSAQNWQQAAQQMNGSSDPNLQFGNLLTQLQRFQQLKELDTLINNQSNQVRAQPQAESTIQSSSIASNQQRQHIMNNVPINAFALQKLNVAANQLQPQLQQQNSSAKPHSRHQVSVKVVGSPSEGLPQAQQLIQVQEVPKLVQVDAKAPGMQQAYQNLLHLKNQIMSRPGANNQQLNQSQQQIQQQQVPQTKLKMTKDTFQNILNHARNENLLPNGQNGNQIMMQPIQQFQAQAVQLPPNNLLQQYPSLLHNVEALQNLVQSTRGNKMPENPQQNFMVSIPMRQSQGNMTALNQMIQMAPMGGNKRNQKAQEKGFSSMMNENMHKASPSQFKRQQVDQPQCQSQGSGQ